MSKNLIIRTSVAAVAIPIILTICYTGGYWYFGLISLFAIAAMCEFLVNEGYRPKNPAFWGAILTIAISVVFSRGITFSIVSLGGPPTIYFLPPAQLIYPLIVGFFMISSMIMALGRTSPVELFKSHARLLWGVFYLTLLYPFLLALQAEPILDQVISPSVRGDLLLFLFALLWVGDTCAMGFGKWLGKHKLAPSVSPNKTVEGFIGGIVGAVAIGVLMYFWKFPHLGFIHVMAIAVGCSIFGQLGDLVESMWKRSLGIKDSSAIIPGHGGVLDRFDSLLFAAPFMYGYLMLLS
jgi:phosphatidate cytidylyltransferase